MRRMTAVNRARALDLRAFNGIAGDEDVDTLDAMDHVDALALGRLAAQWLDPAAFRVVIAR